MKNTKNYIVTISILLISILNVFCQETIEIFPIKGNSKDNSNSKISAPLSDWVLNGSEIYNLSTFVGIGTSTPSYKLDILHSGSNGLRVTSSSSFSVIDIDAFSGDAAIRFAKNGTNQWNIRNNPTTNDFEFFELGGGGGSRVIIQNTTGNFGINDAIPSEKLSIVGKIKIDNVSKGANKVLTSDANGVGTWQNVGTSASGWAVVGANMYNSGLGNIGIGTSTTNAQLQLSNALANRKIILFETANNDHQYYGFGINGAALRYQVDNIASSHIFYAGQSTSTSKELFRISGNGSVTVNGQFTLTSDERLKKNVRNIENTLSKVSSLNAKAYNWIDETKSKITQFGFLAQEIEKIYPNLVQTNEDGYKSVNYIGLVPVLLESIKELKQELDQKNIEINSIHQKLSSIEAKLEGTPRISSMK